MCAIEIKTRSNFHQTNVFDQINGVVLKIISDKIRFIVFATINVSIRIFRQTTECVHGTYESVLYVVWTSTYHDHFIYTFHNAIYRIRPSDRQTKPKYILHFLFRMSIFTVQLLPEFTAPPSTPQPSHLSIFLAFSFLFFLRNRPSNHQPVRANRNADYIRSCEKPLSNNKCVRYIFHIIVVVRFDFP